MSRYDKGKHSRKKNKAIAVLTSFFLLIAFGILGYIVYQMYAGYQNKLIYQEISSISEEIPSENTAASVRKVRILNERNSDVIGWLQIPDTIIDYPILQGSNNDYYLTYNYRKEKSKYGSIFLKKECNIQEPYSNQIIYGHNMKDGQMFSTLLKYQDYGFFEKHRTIKIATQQEESMYQIVSVFKSRIFYQDEEDVFRYYDYTEFKKEEEYNEFIQNCKQLQLYETGISAEFGEQLATLITCEYSQPNGRLVVIAKKGRVEY